MMSGMWRISEVIREVYLAMNKILTQKGLKMLHESEEEPNAAL